MDSSGNFVVAWESYRRQRHVSRHHPPDDYPGRNTADSADSYGIYFRRFSADGTPMITGDHNANLVMTVTGVADTPGGGNIYTNGNQLNPSLAIDGNNQCQLCGAETAQLSKTECLSGPTLHDTSGIFVRNFTSASYTPNIEFQPKT